MRCDIDMQEMYERIGIHNHKSSLPHGAIYKMVQDLRKVKNVWAYGTSLGTSERRDQECGSRYWLKPQRDHELGQNMVIPMKGTCEGPPAPRLVTTKGYSTTTALSTLNALLTTNYLRRGDGILKMADSRRRERLFGSSGSGRIAAKSSGMKHFRADETDADYDPRNDSCLAAFIVLLAKEANANAEQPWIIPPELSWVPLGSFLG